MTNQAINIIISLVPVYILIFVYLINPSFFKPLEKGKKEFDSDNKLLALVFGIITYGLIFGIVLIIPDMALRFVSVLTVVISCVGIFVAWLINPKQFKEVFLQDNNDKEIKMGEDGEGELLLVALLLFLIIVLIWYFK